MTPYESLSLALLAKIASGINLLLADRVMTGDKREDYLKVVSAWTEQFGALEQETAAAINLAHTPPPVIRTADAAETDRE
jgi:hypothetical protein